MLGVQVLAPAHLDSPLYRCHPVKHLGCVVHHAYVKLLAFGYNLQLGVYAIQLVADSDASFRLHDRSRSFHLWKQLRRHTPVRIWSEIKVFRDSAYMQFQ